MTVRDYMEPALRARIGTFNPGPREFFSEVDYRDRQIMLTHDYHWFDLAQMAKEPHRDPIRRGRCSTTSSSPAPRGTPPAGKR